MTWRVSARCWVHGERAGAEHLDVARTHTAGRATIAELQSSIEDLRRPVFVLLPVSVSVLASAFCNIPAPLITLA